MDNKFTAKKTCHFCLYIRPNKNNYCIIQSEKIKEPKSHSCEYFSLDKFVEGESEQKSEEPYKQKTSLKEVF